MDTIHDVIIVGGGPAGLTAAMYAGRSHLTTLLFEGTTPGGQLNTISNLENYPGFPEGISGTDLTDKLVEQATKFSAKIEYQAVESVKREGDIFKVTSLGEEFKARAVIIATGLSQQLGVPGEEKYLGKGVSYCATCDAPLYRRLTTAIVGGSKHAVEEALSLASFAQKVYIITPGKHITCGDELCEAVLAKDNVEVIPTTKVTDIYGDGSLVTGIKTENLLTKEHSDMPLEGVFIYIGKRAPDTKFLEVEVERDKKGLLKVDDNFMTSVDGLYSIGDVRAKSPKQVATAVGDAATCAMYIKTRAIAKD